MLSLLVVGEASSEWTVGGRQQDVLFIYNLRYLNIGLTTYRSYLFTKTFCNYD